MMVTRFVWVVEIKCFLVRQWEPTVGVGLTRIDGREVLKKWKRRNPCDKFRLRKYGYMASV